MTTKTSQEMTMRRLHAEKNQDKTEQQRLWHDHSLQNGLSNEWTVAARLREPAVSAEQIHMIANLFGR